MRDYDRSQKRQFHKNRHHDEKEYEKEIDACIGNFEDKELLGEKAEHIAEIITGKQKKMLSSSQLRNFYAEVKAIERLLRSGNAASGFMNPAWETLYPRIKLIKAKALYNKHRRSGIPEEYSYFLQKCVDKINFDDGEKTFQRFCRLFEAVVGYASPYLKKQ